MLDDQFISSPSWLPSPRFELWTLVGYNILAPSQNHSYLLPPILLEELVCSHFVFSLRAD